MKQGPVMWVLFICVVVSAIAFLYLFGFLPEPLQSQISRLGSIVSLRPAPAAYLQKFEGRWQLSLGDGTGTAGVDCSGGAGEVSVRGGEISGSIDGAAGGLLVQGLMAADGGLTGTAGSGFRVKTIEATITGASGTGYWGDNFECSGSVTLSKKDPIVDPAIGRVASFSGSASLLRGRQTRQAYAGEPLYTGDIIEASGGEVVLSFGLYPQKIITVPAGGSYTVSEHY